MNNYYTWQMYIQHMQQQMEQQQKIIEQLQYRLDELSSKEHPKTVIEKIEYHFDQLKIDTLEGTLQIGLTPNGSELSDLGEFYPGHSVQPQNPVLHNLQEYMTTDIPQWMNRYARDHDIPLTDDHKEKIMEDVQKQLPTRVDFYKNQHPDMDDDTLLHQIQTEVRQSLAQYFGTLNGGDPS